MELLLDIIFEIYLELMMLVVPEKKAASKKHRAIAVLVAILVLICVFTLFIWGCVLLDCDNNLGMIPIILAVAASLAQIVAGIVLYFKKSK